MKAAVVHEFGEPWETFVLEEVEEPTPAHLAGLGMSLGGWIERPSDDYPVFEDWAIMDIGRGRFRIGGEGELGDVSAEARRGQPVGHDADPP